MKTLIAMTVVGFGVIGLVIWVYFASYPGGATGPPARPKIHGCSTNYTGRDGVCRKPDGSIWIVQTNGKVVEIQPAHG